MTTPNQPDQPDHPDDSIGTVDDLTTRPAPGRTAGSTPPVGSAGASATGASGGSDATGGSESKERAQRAAGTAQDEAKKVAGTAQQEAKNVASTAASQAQDLLGQATSQVDDQARTQKDRLTGVLSSLSDDLDGMAEGAESGMATDLVRQAAERARSLSSHLDAREPRDLLDDVRHFARRRPGTFLLSALAAGVVAGRLTRGARDAGNGGGGASSSTPPRGPDQFGTSTLSGPTGSTGPTTSRTDLPPASALDDGRGSGSPAFDTAVEASAPEDRR